MGDRRNTPLHGTPDITGYSRAPSYPQLQGSLPPLWYQPPKEKSTAEKIKDWIPTVVFVAAVVGAIATTWRDWEQMKADTAEQRVRAVEFAKKLDAIGSQASNAWGAATDAATQVRELNTRLERLNLTGPRRRPRPEPSTP